MLSCQPSSLREVDSSDVRAVSAADEALDSGHVNEYGQSSIALDDLAAELDDPAFYGNSGAGGGLCHFGSKMCPLQSLL